MRCIVASFASARHAQRVRATWSDTATSALIEAAPERIMWGSDWPHPNQYVANPNDADLVDAFGDWVGDDGLRRKIMVDTPAAFYRFALAGAAAGAEGGVAGGRISPNFADSPRARVERPQRPETHRGNGFGFNKSALDSCSLSRALRRPPRRRLLRVRLLRLLPVSFSSLPPPRHRPPDHP